MTRYPAKKKKTAVKNERFVVCVLRSDSGFILASQRPDSGLLANLIEFPSVKAADENDLKRSGEIAESFRNRLDIGIREKSLEYRGEISHKFSHIHHQYSVWTGEAVAEIPKGLKLLKEEEIDEAPISRAMRKVFQESNKKTAAKKRQKQTNINSFFQAKRVKNE